MKKFEGMLFCTDLDGTLYNDERKVSKENLDAIEYFKSEGGIFTFITGRVPLTALQICDIIHPNGPFGCINGGGIYSLADKKLLWYQFLNEKFTELVEEIDQKMPEIGIQYNTVDQIYFANENPVWEFFRKVTGVEGERKPFKDIKDPVLKVVLSSYDEHKIQELEKLLSSHPLADKFDFIRSEQALYEILPKNVSKGNALYKMAEILSIDKRKTIAVGDYDNDLSMIKMAGLGFAVENAIDQAKKICDYVTVNNNNHAIAAIIDGIDKGKYKI